MEDKLELLYKSLSANPNVKGLPQDYNSFATALQDPTKSQVFYNSLRANPNIKGLPNSYDDFVNGLAIKAGGIEAPEQQGFLQGLQKKLRAGVNTLGEMVTEIPQAVEAVANIPGQMIAGGMINREVKRGNIDEETAGYLRQNKDVLAPKTTGLALPVMPGAETIGESIANGSINQWFENRAKELNDSVTRYDKSATDYIKNKEFGKALGVITYGIAESLPSTLAAMFAPEGALMLGLGTGAQKYDEVKDNKNMGEAMKLADAFTTGMFEWLFEKFGTAEMGKYLGKYMQRAGTEGLQKAFQSGPVMDLISKGYKKMGIWFAPIHEGVSELLTTMGQNAAMKYSGENPDVGIMDNTVESFLIGAGMGGMFSSTAALTKKATGGIGGDESPLNTSTGPLDTPETADAKEIINVYGERLKFNSNVPLAEDQNPLISIAAHKTQDKRFFLTGESGKLGDHIFTGYDYDALKEAGYDFTKVTPQLLKASDIKERMDIPYDQWLQSEVDLFTQAKMQAEKIITTQQSPIQPGQVIDFEGKQWNVAEVATNGNLIADEVTKEGMPGESREISLEELQNAPPTGVTEKGENVPIAQTGPVTEQSQELNKATQIPVNKQGEVEYDKITEPEIYAQGLQQEFGEEAGTILDELISEQKTALEKAKKGTNAIDRARKVKNINAELTRLTQVKSILSPVVAEPVSEIEPVKQEATAPVETKAEEQITQEGPEREPTVTEPVAEQPEQKAEEEIKTSLTKAAAEVDIKPSEPQKEAGNYQKGHVTIQGMEISIENPAGSIRKGTDKDGKDWAVMLNNHYGYFRRTKGKDGDQIDVFIGDNPESGKVYVIDQVNPKTGEFDEHKVMLGFNNILDAEENYNANYDANWKGLGATTEMTIEELKAWLGDNTRTNKPLDSTIPVKVQPEVKTEATAEIAKPQVKTIQFFPNSAIKGKKVKIETTNAETGETETAVVNAFELQKQLRKRSVLLKKLQDCVG